MEKLGIRPVLDAGLALGEGTGAVMMCGLLDIAADDLRRAHHVCGY